MKMNRREAREYAFKYKRLPDDLTEVNDFLDLEGAPIEKLPDNLIIWGGLDLTNSAIKQLPRGLKIGASLMIANTAIKEIPEDIVVRGHVVDIRGTKIQDRDIPKQLIRFDISIKRLGYVPPSSHRP